MDEKAFGRQNTQAEHRNGFRHAAACSAAVSRILFRKQVLRAGKMRSAHLSRRGNVSELRRHSADLKLKYD